MVLGAGCPGRQAAGHGAVSGEAWQGSRAKGVAEAKGRLVGGSQL
jgi:hypothetical protein